VAECRRCGASYQRRGNQFFCSKSCRFWFKVDTSGGEDACWPWTAHRDSCGYGVFSSRVGKIEHATRTLWEMLTSSHPGQSLVLHRCDNPPCCNPKHLFLGSDADNAADRKTKGRGGGHKISGDAHFSRTAPDRLARGDRNGARTMPDRLLRGVQQAQAKLTDDAVRMIRAERAAGRTVTSLAKELGVSRAAVNNVLSGRRWKHVA
jgi:hypothetical protein